MLVIRVELHSANTLQITEIARMVIANDGTGSKTKGNYWGRVYRAGSKLFPLDKNVVREARVSDYPRLNLSVWVLVGEMLANMGYFRRGSGSELPDMGTPPTPPSSPRRKVSARASKASSA